MQPTLLAEMFLVEAEGISLCLRVLGPGRSVSVLVASMECVLQAASNPEEFVRELVADQVLEHEGGGKAPRDRWHLSCILLKMPALLLPDTRPVASDGELSRSGRARSMQVEQLCRDG